MAVTVPGPPAGQDSDSHGHWHGRAAAPRRCHGAACSGCQPDSESGEPESAGSSPEYSLPVASDSDSLVALGPDSPGRGRPARPPRLGRDRHCHGACDSRAVSDRTSVRDGQVTVGGVQVEVVLESDLKFLIFKETWTRTVPQAVLWLLNLKKSRSLDGLQQQPCKDQIPRTADIMQKEGAQRANHVFSRIAKSASRAHSLKMKNLLQANTP